MGSIKDDFIPYWCEHDLEWICESILWKYFFACAKNKKITKFMNLTQDNLSVDEYETKFLELSRFVPRLVNNGEDKGKRFLDILRTNIKKQLVPFDIKDYNQLYNWAQLVGQELIKERNETEHTTKLIH